MPDLGSFQDVSEFVTKSGYGSVSWVIEPRWLIGCGRSEGLPLCTGR